ncbi:MULTISPECIES: OmpA family protein [unclassified Variovorax]|uniref:OmpA family protein n=1 Tax=unclassified Variovorax TaxID=663243 RepID=UPI00210E2E66|nr:MULTISPECIES: OmpA family protein [unclassified Variovorax]
MSRVVSRPVAGFAFAYLLLVYRTSSADAQLVASEDSRRLPPAQVLILRDDAGNDEIHVPVDRRDGAQHMRPPMPGQEPMPGPSGQVFSAAELGRSLDVNGKVVIGGVMFNDRDHLDPSSKPALDQIGKLMKLRPGLRLHVVGHTDNIGALAGNREISKRQAHAICVALVVDYGIERNRLTANGMGSLSPMVSNQSSRGRARNQRVELVAQ